jgi:hypothetical protein
MMAATRFERLGEFEEELEEEAAELELLFPRGRPLGMPRTMMAPRCPADTQYTLIGFSRYSDDIRLLPNDQQKKLDIIAREITNSLSGAPGATPVAQVVAVGHADLDAARERGEPGFLQFISEKRAQAASLDLCCRLDASLRDRIRWIEKGRGARALAVSNPRTEAERKCNRRVEITLVRSPQGAPQLNPDQVGQALMKLEDFVDFYHVALQGTSGQYDKPQLAEKKAREIAEKAQSFNERRQQDCFCESPAAGYTFRRFFTDALQGTASKFSDPDVVINKAAEIADQAKFGVKREQRRLEWKYAPLPQAMGVDCEPGGRVPGGPVNHVICRTHGHILDTSSRTVIAHDPEEYKKRPPGRVPATERLMRRQPSRRI